VVRFLAHNGTNTVVAIAVLGVALLLGVSCGAPVEKLLRFAYLSVGVSSSPSPYLALSFSYCIVTKMTPEDQASPKLIFSV
jgi:hypothetical protein